MSSPIEKQTEMLKVKALKDIPKTSSVTYFLDVSQNTVRVASYWGFTTRVAGLRGVVNLILFIGLMGRLPAVKAFDFLAG